MPAMPKAVRSRSSDCRSRHEAPHINRASTSRRAGPPQARPDPLGGSIAVPGDRGVVMNPAALIAEDEPLLAANLQAELARLWPELRIVANVGHGAAAVEHALALKPDVVF